MRLSNYAGRTATVELRQWSERDSFGNYVESYSQGISVPVLVQLGRCEDLDAARPEGVIVEFTLHFPKTWDAESNDLRGARVTLYGEYAGTYRVISSPHPLPKEICPPHVPWNMPVEVERVDG